MTRWPFGEDRPPVRLWLIPLASVLAGSLLTLAPIATPVPLLPPFGLLVLLGWRLLRPEHWGAWIGLPLGLADDLIGGAPLGQAMMIWTIVLLALDFADAHIVWRDRWTDWLLATQAIAFASLAAWCVERFVAGAGPWWTMVAPAATGMLCFPLAARICATLDRVRLRRFVLG